MVMWLKRVLLFLTLCWSVVALGKGSADALLPSHEMDYLDSVQLQVRGLDTFYLARMHEIWVYPKMVFKNKQQERFSYHMSRTEELLAQVLKKDKEECKACKIILWVLAIVGIIAAVAGIAYAVYRFVKPDYLEDYEDDIDDEFDYDDDFFDDDDFEEDFEEAVEEVVEDTVE